jgi:hypothetical protein
MVYLFCAVRKLIFHLWYSLEKNVTCPGRVLILQITGVLMFYIVAEHYLAYFCCEAVKLQAVRLTRPILYHSPAVLICIRTVITYTATANISVAVELVI